MAAGGGFLRLPSSVLPTTMDCSAGEPAVDHSIANGVGAQHLNVPREKGAERAEESN